MKNIFDTKNNTDLLDDNLVQLAQSGSKEALEALVRKHQEWIFNLASQMVGSPQDAEDATQEILIKMITKLSTFQGKSSFRTWLYRIVTNHILNMRRSKWERMFRSFEMHSRFQAALDNSEFDITQQYPVDAELLIDETKKLCLTGMLLCLDRQQRLALILSVIFGVNSQVGSEIMEIRPENYRQILSRTRKQLSSFMNEKCGLMNEANPCRCANKTRAAIKAGLVDPERLRFNRDSVQQANRFVAENSELVENALESKMQNLFRQGAYQVSPDWGRFIIRLLQRKEVSQIINFS